MSEEQHDARNPKASGAVDPLGSCPVETPYHNNTITIPLVQNFISPQSTFEEDEPVEEFDEAPSTVDEECLEARQEHRRCSIIRERRLSQSFAVQTFARYSQLVEDDKLLKFLSTFQRISLSGPVDPATKEDLVKTRHHVLRALQLRHTYSRFCHHSFPSVVHELLQHENNRVNIETKLEDQDDDWKKDDMEHGEATLEKAGLTDFRQDSVSLKIVKGVFQVDSIDGETFKLKAPGPEGFFNDFLVVNEMIFDKSLNSFARSRLEYLSSRFDLHLQLNGLKELKTLKTVPRRDFYNVRKVDNHVHAASCMNQKHLLRFIKKKVRSSPDEIVFKSQNSGVTMSIKQVFDSMQINPEDLNVDLLDVHVDRNTFFRFDRFNSKYNPIGESKLREIFIKNDNYIQGRYFAELLKEVIFDLEENKYQHSEPRLSIYGRKMTEWDNLATWMDRNDLRSSKVRWMIQIPRIYDIFRNHGLVQDFQEVLRNIFQPLFEATLYPSKHAELAKFIMEISAFDTVDDESKPEKRYADAYMTTPDQWREEGNPPYVYYLYYLYANLSVLNDLRRSRGLNTIKLRPHCGETGPRSHLSAAFLLAENINHGIQLRKSPILQYLYYLGQIGIAVSPLSNNSLFVEYSKNPFPTFFKRGLVVSLTTDDPLQFHYTKEPLIEEYSIGAQVWKLSSVDMCEIARNSVVISDFPTKTKRMWLGLHFDSHDINLRNDMRLTNVPEIRVIFRHETWLEELELLKGGDMVVNDED